MEVNVPPPLDFSGNIAENYKKFKQRINIYMTANGFHEKSDEVKVAILLNTIGEEGIDIFNNFELNEAEQKNYTKVLRKFDEYLLPKKNIVYERFIFYKRVQETNEPVDNFVKELKKLAQSCEFVDEQDMIRDRIVLGIANAAVQEKLLSIADLKLDKAIEVCRAKELLKERVKTMQEEKVVGKVDKKRGTRTKFKTNRASSQDRKNEAGADVEFQCRRCNRRHGPRECPAFGRSCNRCGKLNHFEAACRVKGVQEIGDEDDEEEENLAIESVDVVTGKVHQMCTTAWYENVKIEDKIIKFKLDTGAQVNILPYRLLEKFGKIKLQKTNVILEAYGGHKFKPLGKIILVCRVRDCEKKQEFIVVEKERLPLLGLKSCIELGLIKRVEMIKFINDKQKFIKENMDLFTGTGTFKEKCKIILKPDCCPIVRPPRRIPYSLKDKLKATLDDLEKKQIIVKTDGPVEWASNLVLVEKPNGNLRICLDPVDLNKSIKRELCLLPTLGEVSASLAGKEWFTVLHLKDGFYHVELDEYSSKLCTFNSPFGKYRFKSLPFGLSLAPELFLKLNNKNFGDLEGVIIYIDDILISAETKEKHDLILSKVIDRARKVGVKFNLNKVQFRVNEVQYLGHKFSKGGVVPDKERVKAVVNLKSPQNRKELQRILGMFNYFHSFISKFSEISEPIRNLLKKDVAFSWTTVHEQALNRLKRALAEAPVLANFDVNKDIEIQTDASSGGLGACLLQSGRPVFFASRRLTESEKQYAQIEKEMLAIAFAAQKFKNYIYGKKATVWTDHKPLISIMKKKLADVVSPRLQRFKLKLLRFDLVVKFCPGKYLYVADLLSRNYSMDSVEEDPSMLEVVHNIHAIVNISLEKKIKFQFETENDSVLKKVKDYCLMGWPQNVNKEDKKIIAFKNVKDELTVVENIILFNNRVVVPDNLKVDMLKLAHEGHFGIYKTMKRMQETFYWPNMNQDVNEFVKKCRLCEKFLPAKTQETMIKHDIPKRPFVKVAADIAQYGTNNYLIVFDYYSKWLEIIKVRDKTTQSILAVLKNCFATHGIPEMLIADNMPFGSYNFKKFAEEFGIQIITSSPHYPKSNGQAESGVKIAKSFLKKQVDLDLALLNYRNTEIIGIGYSPAQLLMNRKLRTKLPIAQRSLISTKINKNIVHSKLIDKQDKFKLYFDKKAKEQPLFKVNQNVTFRKGGSWESAKIVKVCKEPRSYLIRDSKGQVLRRNSNHIRQSSIEPTLRTYLSEMEDDETLDNNNDNRPDNVELNAGNEENSSISDEENDVNMENDQTSVKTADGSEQGVGRRPQRNIRQPSRFKDFITYHK